MPQYNGVVSACFHPTYSTCDKLNLAQFYVNLPVHVGKERLDGAD